MSSIPIGVIGADRYADELLQHQAPLPGIRLADWAPMPDDCDHTRVAELAQAAGARCADSWQGLIEDSRLDAILVLGEISSRAVPIAAALRAGKVVLCPFPAATTLETLADLADAQNASTGVLTAFGEISDSGAGSHMLRSLRENRLGKVHSIYLAARTARGDGNGQSVLDEIGWPMLDFLLSCAASPVVRLHAAGGPVMLEGQHDDTAVVLIRFASDLVATLELSRCLPPSIAVARAGEIEIEAIGASEVIRLQPQNAAVRVFADTGPSLRPWTETPLLASLAGLVGAVRDRSHDDALFARMRSAIALMDEIRSQLADREVQRGRATRTPAQSDAPSE
jgi:predicted dehydrogenase